MTLSAETIAAVVAGAKFAPLRAVSRVLRLGYNTVRKYAKRAVNPLGPKRRTVTSGVRNRRRKLKKLWAETSSCGDRVWKTYATSTQLANALKRVHGVVVDPSVVRKDLKSLGLHCRVRKPVPTRQRAELEKQRSWAAWVLRQEIGEDDVLHSDEVIISTKENTGRYQWVKKGERPFPREAKSRRNYASLHVWACVGVNYKSPLVIFPKKVNGEKFNVDAAAYRRRCLSKVSGHMTANPHLYFTQDGARPHTAASTRAYLERKGWKYYTNPPYCPQVNMIELVWKMFHEEIGKENPTTEQELRVAALVAWQRIPMEKINEICRHWAKAVKAVKDQ